MTGLSFDRFLEYRKEAGAAYISGDGSKVDELVVHDGAASFHSPRGDTVTGAKNVAKRFLGDAKAFHPNGTGHFEIIQQDHDERLGFWTGYQIATVQIRDMPRPIEMRIRITEVFRKDDGEWKLIHRHADAPTK